MTCNRFFWVTKDNLPKTSYNRALALEGVLLDSIHDFTLEKHPDKLRRLGQPDPNVTSTLHVETYHKKFTVRMKRLGSK